VQAQLQHDSVKIRIKSYRFGSLQLCAIMTPLGRLFILTGTEAAFEDAKNLKLLLKKE
jgi:hypothetical protein